MNSRPPQKPRRSRFHTCPCSCPSAHLHETPRINPRQTKQFRTRFSITAARSRRLPLARRSRSAVARCAQLSMRMAWTRQSIRFLTKNLATRSVEQGLQKSDQPEATRTCLLAASPILSLTEPITSTLIACVLRHQHAPGAGCARQLLP
jgi:hypothetical protein